MADSNKTQPQRTFEIGQIVYVLSDKAEAIVPAIVVEELVHKKLDGNSISWKVAVGPPSKKKIVASDELSGEIYNSLDEIQRVMLKRLGNFVTNLIDKAHERTEAWYGKQIPKPDVADIEADGGKIDPASLLDTIDGRENAAAFLSTPGQEISAARNAAAKQESASHGPLRNADGSIRVQAPGPIQGPLRPQADGDPSDPRYALRHRLREMADPTQEELRHSPTPPMESSGDVLIMEDGTRVPVNFNPSE